MKHWDRTPILSGWRGSAFHFLEHDIPGPTEQNPSFQSYASPFTYIWEDEKEEELKILQGGQGEHGDLLMSLLFSPEQDPERRRTFVRIRCHFRRLGARESRRCVFDFGEGITSLKSTKTRQMEPSGHPTVNNRCSYARGLRRTSKPSRFLECLSPASGSSLPKTLPISNNNPPCLNRILLVDNVKNILVVTASDWLRTVQKFTADYTCHDQSVLSEHSQMKALPTEIGHVRRSWTHGNCGGIRRVIEGRPGNLLVGNPCANFAGKGTVIWSPAKSAMGDEILGQKRSTNTTGLTLDQFF